MDGDVKPLPSLRSFFCYSCINLQGKLRKPQHFILEVFGKAGTTMFRRGGFEEFTHWLGGCIDGVWSLHALVVLRICSIIS